MKIKLLAIVLCIAFYGKAQNTPPTVFINSANVNEINKTVTINYNLQDAQNDACTVWLKYSKDGGVYYDSIAANFLTGAVGNGVSGGNNKSLIWNYSSVSTNIYASRIKLYASDNQIVSINDLINQVDSNLLRSNLNYVAGVRHLATSPVLINKVRDSIESKFKANNLETEKQSFTFNSQTGINIIGRKAGVFNEAKTYIIDAHYDGVANSPGADDNGSGVVGLLEAARILSKYNFENSIKFIGFDFEESGLIGSLRYNQNGIKSYETINGVLNFEMIGYYTNKVNSQSTPAGFNLLFPQTYNALVADSFRGNFLVVCGNTNSNLLTNTFLNATTNYVPQLKALSVEVPQNGQIAPDFRRSDHASFWDNNVKALMLTDGADTRNKAYHTAGDSIGNLNFTFMSNIVKATIATAATLAKPISAGFAEFNIAPLSNNELHKHQFPAEVTIYPNPNNGILNLTINATENLVTQITIFDLAGNEVFAKQLFIKKGNDNYTIKLNNLKAGNYILLIKEGDATLSKVLTIN